MTFEDIQAEIAVLIAHLGDAPHDRHETELVLHEKLARLKAFGMPLPQDLVDLEAALRDRLEAAARKRARGPGTPCGN